VERTPEVIGMSDDVTRLTKVRPANGRVLRVRFAGDRRDHELDMTGLIARSAHFAALMNDPVSLSPRWRLWKTVLEWRGQSKLNGIDWTFRLRPLRTTSGLVVTAITAGPPK
jgi:hypothetical protein